MYPNSLPEFRMLQNAKGESRLQVRYHCPAQGYLSKWLDIPVVIEND